MFKVCILICLLHILLLFGCGPQVGNQSQGENLVVKPDFSQLSDAIFNYQLTEEKLDFGVDTEVLVDSLAKLSFALESLSSEQIQFISKFNNQYISNSQFLSKLSLKIDTVKEIWALKRRIDASVSSGFYEHNIKVFTFPTKFYDSDLFFDRFPYRVKLGGYADLLTDISNVKRYLRIFPNAFYLYAGRNWEYQIELSDKIIRELIEYNISHIDGVRLDQEPRLTNFFQLVDSQDFSESGPYGRSGGNLGDNIWSGVMMRTQYGEVFNLISNDVEKLKGYIKN